MSLRGNAQAILGNLFGDSKKDFATLCKALEERFSPVNQTELYRAQLRERRQNASESIPELGQDIRRLTNLAYASAPIDVRETLAKEQFIDALINSEMRLRIKQSRPKDLNDAICHAVELDAFNNAEKRLQDSRGFVRVAEQNSEGSQWSSVQKAIGDMNKLISELQAEVKEIKGKQTRRTVRPNDMSTECSKSERKCYFCNREGHMKRD